jgi:hypothetical protein
MGNKITFLGDDFEELLLKILPKSSKGPQKVCDILWETEFGKITIELKDGNPNQTRPYKKNILVIRKKPEDLFYVIPASVVLMTILDKKGQHTQDAVCCCNPYLRKSASRFLCSLNDLPQSILEAYQYDQQPQFQKIWRFIDTRIEEWNRQLEQNKQFKQELIEESIYEIL